MKKKLLNLLACPICGGDILLTHVNTYEDEEIIEAVLNCKKCEREYKVVRGVPYFADVEKIEEDKAETAKNFGWSWNKFNHGNKKYAEQLLGWLKPVNKDFFKGKIILEGGCGKGRHTFLAHEWGAEEIVGIDLSSAVDAAYQSTRHLPNAHIVQGDIFNLPFKKNVFDYAFSVGVLHHTPDPKKAFKSLAALVKKGGHISAWIYGQENNDWIINYVNPIRTGLTSKMKHQTLYQLSKLPTLGVFLASKLLYTPLNKTAKPFADKLFYNDYLTHIGTFGWREQHSIVFDHLVAPTAFYIPKTEFEEWWKEIDAADVKITWHNQNSWCGFGKIVE